jgi:hypothetical protein
MPAHAACMGTAASTRSSCTRPSIRYSGRWTDKNVAKYKAKLEQHLAANKVDVIGEFSTAVYNAPFTPPFMRRNEIHYEISALPER